jgi:hypothetical protein
MSLLTSRLRRGRREVVRATRRLRGSGSLPGFVVIGAQRAGTTTLFFHLRRHPAIGDASRKEVHFFDSEYARGDDWYRSFFPSDAAMRRKGERFAGEATPSYLFHPLAPARAAELLPDAGFLVMLRDPVDRAWSHYAHQVALGNEALSFDRAIAAEAERLEEEVDRVAADPDRSADRLRRYSYLARGNYAPQLERWFEAVGRARVHTIVSEEFFRDPEPAFRSLERFLELPRWDGFGSVQTHHASGAASAGMSAETRAQLRAHFAPKIARTEELLDRELPWPRAEEPPTRPPLDSRRPADADRGN